MEQGRTEKGGFVLEGVRGDYSANMSVLVCGIRFGRLAAVGPPPKTQRGHAHGCVATETRRRRHHRHTCLHTCLYRCLLICVLEFTLARHVGACVEGGPCKPFIDVCANMRVEMRAGMSADIYAPCERTYV